MRQHVFPVFFLLVLSLGLIQGETKPLLNTDVIEMSRGGVPSGTIITSIQTAVVNFDVSPEGLVALHAGGVSEAVLNEMIRANSRAKFQASFGVATGTFPVKEALGQTVRYSAWIKTENVANGYAGIWWRVDGSEKNQTLAFDNSQARFIGNAPAAGNGVIRGATGTTEWTRYEFELPVAAGARNINFGLILTGTGTAWFDSLKIEVNSASYLNPAAFDFDFESTSAKGFYTGGNGYKVGIDKTLAKTGSQSLKMQFVGDGGQGKTGL
jgi:hypothetical protein